MFPTVLGVAEEGCLGSQAQALADPTLRTANRQKEPAGKEPVAEGAGGNERVELLGHL